MGNVFSFEALPSWWLAPRHRKGWIVASLSGVEPFGVNKVDAVSVSGDPDSLRNHRLKYPNVTDLAEYCRFRGVNPSRSKLPMQNPPKFQFHASHPCPVFLKVQPVGIARPDMKVPTFFFPLCPLRLVRFKSSMMWKIVLKPDLIYHYDSLQIQEIKP